MNVFELRKRIIDDYASYISSFIQIRDDRIREYVEKSLAEGLLWPEPLIQLNPSFEPGEWIDELVALGILHPECARVFRIGKSRSTDGRPLRLHRHQAEAVRIARTGNNYVLTTGTGSGKSLAYIIPIVDHVLRNGSGRGIQAIIVYPMNALANSQHGELEKFLCHGYPDGQGPVTFRKYTGQEREDERNRILARPPDILLTNFVMLELILTRPQERSLIQAAQGLRFLVLDELHTYRGRQGADVALLVRRVRDALAAEKMQCVGTSATLAGSGTYRQQRAEVAKVASTLFGDEVKPEHVVGETLRRITPEQDLNDPSFIANLRRRIEDPGMGPSADFAAFVRDPLSIWIETTFGVATEAESGRLVRSRPLPLHGEGGAAQQLSRSTGVPEQRCSEVLQQGLLSGYRCLNLDTGFPAFAFRLHQFISRGDTVYASLEAEKDRHITVFGQQFVPGDRKRALLPLVFCRECGQEYYCVRSRKDASGRRFFEPRDLHDTHNDNGEAGFLYCSTSNPWPADPVEVLQRLPDDWLEDYRGTVRLKPSRRDSLPLTMRITPDATEGAGDGEGLEMQYFPAPFNFCLQCGVAYGSRQRSDFAKLGSLGSEGRSTATTILSLSAIRNLRQDSSLPQKARKLLSFTDNRQDASLQAGHFNDFIEIGLLRSALFAAAEAKGAEGLSHDELTQKVFDALDLPLELYASNPAVRFAALEETRRTMRDVIGYRIYRDLQRGWRLTSPNLEQCGLLEIRYVALDELCASEDVWQNRHEALRTASPETRAKVAKVLLDLMRRELAIKVDYLETGFQERLHQRSGMHLAPPWALDENENLEHAAVLFPRSSRPSDYGGHVYLSSRSGFGQYLARARTFEDYRRPITMQDREQIILDLLEALKVAGLVSRVAEPRDPDDVPGYQLPASAMRWHAGDGTRAFYDPIRRPRESEAGSAVNRFFIDFYRYVGLQTKGLQAREHTAQVPNDLRLEREADFREARLPILYCSPTMELGVDIAELNAVNMRNIPPTPANYSQRSGRAGRSGQPALVFSYCSTGSPHDQYFFKRPERMVMGSVTPPRLDLANEDLVRAHVQAIWLAETGQSLGSSLKDILDLSGESPTLKLQEHVRQSIESERAREASRERAKRLLATLRDELSGADWYSDGWLDQVMAHVPLSFDQACERWRGLYRSALAQVNQQSRIILDASRTHTEREQARRLRREAESQIELLTQAENIAQSDFYSYRYFAGEGFLPGYNFPRLPLSAFIPGRTARNARDEFVSRPRFLAISEFGPRAILYHEGSRYIINKVILPVREHEEEIATSCVRQCGHCGYIHPAGDGEGPDLCHRCRQPLQQTLRQLLRLQNVVTRRRDRISSDEEERLRLGYEIRTGLRFAERGGRVSFRTATVSANGDILATLSYGHAAKLWRMNLGWVRRRDPAQYGFVLDIERGYWARNPQAPDDDDSDPISARTRRVIPYVEDHRNCLLLEPATELPANVMASLQAALKTAIQVRYQLEDAELAAEPLPDRERRRIILFYESAEGGAGVLRRILDDPGALAEAAREALAICHFDPDTGRDLRRPPGAREDCEAACYDCLMSYVNQLDHKLLDRQAVKSFLLRLAASRVSASPAEIPRAEHLQKLKSLAGSALEREWLDYLEANNLHLPSDAQVFIESCRTRPDFLYREHQTAIYIDGPVHDFPGRAERDRAAREAMEDLGFTVIRFGNACDWDVVVARYPHVFGRKP